MGNFKTMTRSQWPLIVGVLQSLAKNSAFSLNVRCTFHLDKISSLARRDITGITIKVVPLRAEAGTENKTHFKAKRQKAYQPIVCESTRLVCNSIYLLPHKQVVGSNIHAL